MKFAWSMIFLVLYLAVFYSAESFSLRAINSSETVPFTADMLPITDWLPSINSSSIQLLSHPSPSITGIDLNQFSGAFTVGLYAGIRVYTTTDTTIYLMNKLNATHQTGVFHLKPDTVYHIYFQSKWHKQNTIIDVFSLDGLYRRECRLLRTYMNDQTTLNPIPPFGEYTWKQTRTNAGTSAIVVNASISLELPYEMRNITVTLGSNSKSQVFKTPLEFVEFEFSELDSEPRNYSLLITFMLVDSTTDHRFTVVNTVNGTVRTTATTTTHNTGNKQFICHFLFLLSSIMFILL